MPLPHSALALASFPDGWLTPEHFTFVDVPAIDPDGPMEDVLDDGDALLENTYLSLDPYMRGRIAQGEHSYTSNFKLWQPIDGYGVSKILHSRNLRNPAGQHVTSVVTRWSNYQVTKRATIEALEKATMWILVEDEPDVPLTYYVGPLDVGLFKYGEPKKGETLFVSGVSRAVGQAVIILAKSFSLRVIGSAGVTKRLLIAWNNYKKPPGGSILLAIKSIAPNGLVGDQQEFGGSDYSITNGRFIVPNRLMIRGFIVRDDRVEWIGRVFDDVKKQIREGKWKAYKEDARKGLEEAPSFFVGMLKGDNRGKAIIQL
ncbi:hypothetical protein M427DRAFT_44241 [Gonapodya prolifera JEL478]|uniref:Oxidoreductase N-terminal domain-containing protein n=1 Tax=Gonapodya prolifera (strain JEL478) TaxID=1344416 RepID=A0A139AGR5_GONPJ|nr:hypothetical protein M427DRAFT_44241 [Gonapodya prolifera JEL478]|eukprot:KXS15879.1 hypothetical protein M427DRAFT_44241 [Gonapodya prolifera JEL478]